MNSRTLSALIPILLATAAMADRDVRVIATGVVEYNQFASGTLVGVPAGSPVTMTIDLDSTQYLDSPNLPGVTRGYRFGPGDLSLMIGSVMTTLRADVTSAYWVLRNNDPRVDGFFLSTGTDIDTPIPLAITPSNYGIAFERTFDGIPPPPSTDPDPTLQSVDLLDALGSWGLDNLSAYNFAIQLGEFNVPLGIEYRTLSIARCAAITGDPHDVRLCDGITGMFSAEVVGTDVTVRWQLELPGSPGTWVTLGNDPLPLPCGGFAYASQPLSTSTPIGVNPCPGTNVYLVRCMASNVCGMVVSRPATLTIGACCAADFNGDGTLDPDDLGDFINCYFAEPPCAGADFNGDAAVDPDDLGDYINAYFAACG